jgi:hypothetical protein
LLPGFFNAIERATRTGNTVVNSTTKENFYDDKLTTQLVKDNIELDIILYDFNTSGEQVTIDRTKLSNDLNKSVGVFLAKNNENNGQLELIKYLGEYKDFTGGKGRLQISDFSSDYAYKDTFIHFYYCNPADMDWTECWEFTDSDSSPVVSKKNDYAGQSDSYDRFSIRPKDFNITSDIDTKIKAGDEFNLTIKALDINGTPVLNYNEPVSISVNSPALDFNVTRAGCESGTLSLVNDVNFTNGEAIVTLTYSDVGDINITLHEISGSEFAHIDLNDTDFNSDTDDSPQIVNDIYREIKPASLIVHVIPYKFNINAILNDYKPGQFTYISEDLNMSSTLELNISAVNKQDDITLNYNSECYAKPIDVNLTFLYGLYSDSTSTVVPVGLNSIHYLIEDREDNSRYSNDRTIAIGDMKLDHYIDTNVVFPSGDHNGTSYLDIKVGFDRKNDTPINPFELNITDINISDEDNVVGTTTVDTNATYLYARAKATKDFYDDVSTSSTKTPIKVEVYCDKWPASVKCPGVDVVNGATNDSKWYISTAHNSDNGDGHIYPFIDASYSASVSPAEANITVDGIDKDVTVTNSSDTLPYIVNVTLDDTSPTETSSWLIYNPDSPILYPSVLYKVRFIGSSTWSGVGKTGNVVDTDISTKKSHRLDW